jgi:predicted nucleic acid-binding protein
MSRIFWDTNAYIYLFEGHPIHQKEVASLRSKMLNRGDELLTTWLTIGEIQVRSPKRLGVDVARYRDAIVKTGQILSFEEEASKSYRDIRETTSVRGPDALQLACAAAAGVEIFVTNDTKLHGLKVRGIHFITSISAAEQLL